MRGLLPSGTVSRSVLVRTKFVPKACILQQLAGASDGFVADKDAARQYAKRAFKHAHIAIDDHMRNFSAIEQSFDRPNQDGIIGADKFTQYNLLRFPNS
jgi:hypothetical protein